MKNIELSESEIQSVSDLLLFKSIVGDNSEVVTDIIKRFEIKPNHRIVGLCEPMSYISQNFIEISDKMDNRYKRRLSSVSAISVLEEQINKEFCTKGIHSLELAIKIDALSVFHALLDAGHKDYDSEVVFLAIKYLRPDMLKRLHEDGFDLWKEHKEWGCRPIDTLHMMISFRDELSIMSISDLFQKFTECLNILIKASEIKNILEYYKPFSEDSEMMFSKGWCTLRERDSFSQLGTIFYNILHGLNEKDI